MEKKFDLSSLRLDETGRVVIEPKQLENLPSSEGIPASGAGIFFDDGPNFLFCGGETNGTCYNWLSCDDSTNRDSCGNYFCDGSRNESSCMQEGCPPPE